MTDVVPIDPKDLLPAQNLEDAIFLCDPRAELKTTEDIKAFYVDRGSIARREMQTNLVVNDLRRGQTVKYLFTGHKGSGKTSEINRLIQDIGSQFFVVPVTFGNRQDVTYVDMIVKAANSLFTAATDQHFVNHAAGQIAHGLWQNISKFLQTTIIGDLPFRNQLGEASGNLGLKIHALGVEFEGKYDSEASSREKVRTASENRLEEFVKYINELSAEIRFRDKRPVLFVFGDTDKLDITPATELFYARTRAITSFQPSAIYQFPIGLRWSTKMANIFDSFSKVFTLENFKLKLRTGEHYQNDVDCLRGLLARRVNACLFEPGAQDRVIASSGGHLRSLIRLVNSAANIASARGGTRIQLPDAERAERQLRGEFISMLKSDAYATLKARHLDQRISADDNIQEMLQSLALLEYANGGDPWCDVHPALLPAVLERAP